MKIAPSRLFVPALLAPLAAFFGPSGFHAEEDPADAFVHDRTESVLHLSLDSPSGASIDVGGPPAHIGIYLQRNSWEIWRQTSTGLEEFREAVSTPESGASVNLSLSTEMGTLGAATVITDGNGRASTTYSGDGNTGGVFLNATAGNSTASLFLEVTYMAGNLETWTYSHTEATLVAALTATYATGEVSSGETRDLALSVRYDTWDVMTSSNGNSRAENQTSAPAEGASVTWVSESGDGSVSGYSTVDSAGMCHGNLMMGSVDTVIRADVSYAAGQATSASLYFAAAPPPSISGDSGSERTFSRSETIASITNLSADGSNEVAMGESRTITGEVRQETWDIWVDSYGMEEWRHSYSGPSAWAPVNATLEFGDGNLSSSPFTTNGQGWFSVTYTMGSSPARIMFSTDAYSIAAGGSVAVEFSLSSGGGMTGTGDGASSAATFSYLYNAGGYRLEGPHSDGPTYDLTPGTQRTISGVLFWDSWEVWGDQFGNSTFQNRTSSVLPSTSISLSIVLGDGVVSGNQITTDALGGFSTPFTMGSGSSRVRLLIESGTNDPLAVELDFTPPQTGSDTTWILLRNESSLFVSLSIADSEEGPESDSSIPLRAQVTETTWEVWEDASGSSELRNHRTGPAIGASLSFSILSGSGILTALDATTNADGVARSEIIPAATDSIVVANASFATTEASARLTVSAVPWTFQNAEGELELTLATTGDPANGISATVHYRTREIWMNPLNGTTQIRHEAEGPAANAEVSFQSLSDSGGEAPIFSPSTVMTGANGIGTVTYTLANGTWGEVTVQFAGMTVTKSIMLPANYIGSGGGEGVDGYGGGPAADVSGGNPGNDGAGGTGGQGGSPGTVPSTEKQNQVPIHIRGREHQTWGGGGNPSAEEGNSTVIGSDTTARGEGPSLAPYYDLVNLGPTYSEFEDIMLYARFAATLTRDRLAADGFTVTGTEETRVSGSADEENDIILPYILAGWTIKDREDLEPYLGYRWFATFAGSKEEGSPRIEATGEAFEVKGRETPLSDPSVLRTLASEEEIKSLYHQLGTPPKPGVFWNGDIGDMGFGAAAWSAAMRIDEGGNQQCTSMALETDSFADFIEGITPSVKWSEYWAQSTDTIPSDGGKATKTLLIAAKQSTGKSAPPVTWFATVTFEILANQIVSTTAPTVTWLSSSPPTSWIEVDPNGVVRLQPEVQRGMKNEIKVVVPEVVELSPKLRDAENNEISHSEMPKNFPESNSMVEEAPNINRIAHREVKVRVSSAMKGKKITWMMEAGFTRESESQPSFRGDWAQAFAAHRDRFETSITYGAHGYRRISQEKAETTIDLEGFSSIRVNLPPVGFNKARIKVQMEGSTAPVDLIDMDVQAVVVIDPGHGGTPKTDFESASWNNSSSPSGVLEKAMTLRSGQQLKASLEAHIQEKHLNVRVLISRTSDVSISGRDRAYLARDNGADQLFIIHFNATDSHKARGTLEVRQVPNLQASTQGDIDFINEVLVRVVPAMRSFDTGCNLRPYFVKDTTVATDLYMGNEANYHPVRAGYCEVEFIDFGAQTPDDQTDDAVDILLNTGPNAADVGMAIANAMRDGIIIDLKTQPKSSK